MINIKAANKIIEYNRNNTLNKKCSGGSIIILIILLLLVFGLTACNKNKEFKWECRQESWTLSNPDSKTTIYTPQFWATKQEAKELEEKWTRTVNDTVFYQYKCDKI